MNEQPFSGRRRREGGGGRRERKRGGSTHHLQVGFASLPVKDLNGSRRCPPVASSWRKASPTNSQRRVPRASRRESGAPRHSRFSRRMLCTTPRTGRRHLPWLHASSCSTCVDAARRRSRVNSAPTPSWRVPTTPHSRSRHSPQPAGEASRYRRSLAIRRACCASRHLLDVSVTSSAVTTATRRRAALTTPEMERRARTFFLFASFSFSRPPSSFTPNVSIWQPATAGTHGSRVASRGKQWTGSDTAFATGGVTAASTRHPNALTPIAT